MPKRDPEGRLIVDWTEFEAARRRQLGMLDVPARPRDPERIALDLEIGDSKPIAVVPEPEGAQLIARQPADEVPPLVEVVAMLVVISRAFDRFNRAVAKRVQFYERGGRR